jgi:hypothetical protein
LQQQERQKKMFNLTNKFNKKAQTGETISWIVATIIIFVILMFFVLGSSLLGGTKKILTYKDSVFDSADEYIFDSHYQKSLYTYFKIEETLKKNKIKTYLEEKGFNFEEKQKELRRLLN